MAIKNQIQIRKGISSDWNSVNPVLASGEPGYDLSNKVLKVGDGTSTWTQLSGINQNIVAGYDISVTNNSGIYTIASTNLVHTDSQQPQGFVNRTDSRISVSGNVFRIEPTGSSYSYYNKGVKVVKTSSDSLTIPNLTQINYIHFNTSNNQLSNKTTRFDFSTDIPIAYIAWNSGVGPSGQMTFFAEERHGIVMDTSTHKWIHYTFGAQYVEGLSISNYSTSGNGSSNSDATIAIGNGTLYQEDIEINITDSSSTDPFCQELSPIAQIPVYYHQGSTGQWVKNAATNYPVKYGVNGPQYNLLSDGTWTTPDVSPGGAERYFAVWILATNQIDDPIISIMGQRVDSNPGSAESNNSWGDVNLTNLPLSEVKPLYRLIFAGDSDFTNTPKCYLYSILDIRVSVISTVAGVSQNDHGSLFGLGDDDHAQYLHVDNNRTVNAIHNFVNGLTVNGTVVSVSGHTHSSSNITDFASSVSGVLPSTLVYTTGNQTISGIKTFLSESLFSGGLSLFANSSSTFGWIPIFDGSDTPDVSSQPLLYITKENFKTDLSLVSTDIGDFNDAVVAQIPTNLVYATGNQTISGIKTFNDTIYAKTNLTVGIDSSSSYSNGEVFKIAFNDSNDLVTINNGTTFSTSYVYLNAITHFNTPSFGNTPLIINPTGYLNTGAITQGYWRGSNIEVDKGGTGRSSYSNGQLLIGSGTSLVANTLTAGTGISITNGSGTITINTSGLQSSLINPITGTGTNNYLSKWTSSSGLGNSLIYDNGTNVGIGTDSPAASLHLVGTGIVDGDLSVNGNLFISSISGTDPVTISSSTASMIINDITIFLQNNTHVDGYLRLNNETADTIAIFNNDKDIVSLTSPTLTELSYVSGVSSNIQTQLDSKQATLINPVTGTGIANHIPYWSSSSGLLADSNQLIWDSTNNRLGIGIQSPTSQLHVVGGGLFSGDIRASGSFIGGSGTALLPSFEFINDPDTGLFSPAANAFGISTSGVERLRVDSAGNVGIGTTTPTYKLQVNGSFAASTKSFRIHHPSKKDHSLEYGSLESPYHGVRLTGRDKVIKGVGTVSLPSYLKDLIHDDDTLNIQITNIKHGKTIYVEQIDLNNDRFIVKADRSKTLGELEFFWSLTGTRKDVEDLVVEKRN